MSVDSKPRMNVDISIDGEVTLEIFHEREIEGGELIGESIAVVKVPRSCQARNIEQYGRFSELYCAIAEAVFQGLKKRGV